MPLVSLVAPCYNEEPVIRLFYEEISRVMRIMSEKEELKYELIFVDDGSKDKTLDIMKELAAQDKFVRYISLSRNFGKEAAMLAGFEHARGDYVAVLDADLQHPPTIIPQMYDFIIREGYDCAATRRVAREGEPKLRSWFARRFYKLINKMTQVDLVDGAQDFRLMTRQYLDAVLSMPEKDRFSKGIFTWVGFKVKYIEVHNVERAAGETTWSFWKLFAYAVDGIASFTVKPMLWAIWTGIFLTIIGLLELIPLLTAIISATAVKNFSEASDFVIWCVKYAGIFGMFAPVTFIGGIIISFIGIIGIYMSKIYIQLKDRPLYLVRETNV